MVPNEPYGASLTVAPADVSHSESYGVAPYVALRSAAGAAACAACTRSGGMSHSPPSRRASSGRLYSCLDTSCATRAAPSVSSAARSNASSMRRSASFGRPSTSSDACFTEAAMECGGGEARRAGCSTASRRCFDGRNRGCAVRER
eukprot:6469563-Prymnesium_polylepis.1